MTQKKKVGIENCSMSLLFYMPDNRRTDLTNKAESVMDLLVDNGILKDDSWQVVNPLQLVTKYCKDNPRVEIFIDEDIYLPISAVATNSALPVYYMTGSIPS